MKRNFAILFSLLFCGYLFAEDYCQYDYLNGKKGNEIRKALYEKLKDHTVLSYSAIRADKSGVDYRANGKVWDMYSDCVFASSKYCNLTKLKNFKFFFFINRYAVIKTTHSDATVVAAAP